TCPTLSEAAGLAASPALRNRATLGGNLGQHTRCGYYRMTSFHCLRRGDHDCPVRLPSGVQETAGIFADMPCAGAHPPSLAAVLGSVGAAAVVVGEKGERRVAFDALWASVERGRRSDLALEPGEVIAHVEIPAISLGNERVGYAEVRQKAAFD